MKYLKALLKIIGIMVLGLLIFACMEVYFPNHMNIVMWIMVGVAASLTFFNMVKEG